MTTLLNFYPIFSAKFLSNGISHFQSAQPSGVAPLYLRSCAYPEAMRDTFKHVLECGERNIDNLAGATLTYVGDGIFCLMTKTNVDPSTLTTEWLIEMAEFEREQIQKWLSKTQTVSELWSLESVIYRGARAPNSYALGFAFSHNLIMQHPNCADVCIPAISKSKTIVESSGVLVDKVSCTPHINAFWLNEKTVASTTGLIHMITIAMATLYEVQGAAKAQSRKIIETYLSSSSIARAAEISEKRVAQFEQFAAEMDTVIYNADPLEETVGQTIAIAWNWQELVAQTRSMVTHMSEQVSRLNNKATREFEERVAKILFGFTLLTVVNVTAGVIEFYDVEDSIAPLARIISMALSLIITVALVYVYLNLSRERS